MSSSAGQAILALIESDLAVVGGPPLIGLLTSLQSAKGNVLLQQAAIMQFVATAPSVGITLGIEVEQQLLGILISKIQGFITSQQPPPA